MQKIILPFFFCFLFIQAFSQTQKKVSAYLLFQCNKTIYDRTLGNNPSGIGLGLQTFLKTKTKFTPTIEVTGVVYLENDKVLRYDTGSLKEINSVSGMINLFAGSLYNLSQHVYLSFVAGPSFISGQTLLGIKPSLGFYFSKNQRWSIKLSYINIFNRDKKTKEDFGSFSFAAGLKLF